MGGLGRAAVGLALALCGFSAANGAANGAEPGGLGAGEAWARSISGTMEVTLNALDTSAAAQPGPPVLGRKGLSKRYHGALEAQAEGDMLTAGGTVKGSAAYVAVERVEGSLDGRSGSFALVHRGLMQGSQQVLLVTVVPDSGTGGLAGLRGVLQIERRDGQHHYRFDYTLP